MQIFSAQKLRLPTLDLVRGTLCSERGVSLVVVLMLMVIILAITGAGLFFSSIDLRVSANYRVGTQAFYAADTGVSAGFSQIVMEPTISKVPFRQTLNGGLLTYCSGTIAATASCTAGQEQELPVTKVTRPGYSLGVGTGYNSSGYYFYQYQIDATGIGPLGATRQVQALALYGPLPN